MRDPDSAQFAKWTELMATGAMIGTDRPVGRVTIGRNVVKGHVSSTRPGVWRNILFEQPRQVEIPGVKSIEINRSMDSDAATCTIVLYNDYMEPGDFAPQGVDSGIGRPGHRTFSRGQVPPIPMASVYEEWATGKGQRTESLLTNPSFEAPAVAGYTEALPDGWGNGNPDEQIDTVKLIPSPTAPHGAQVVELTNAEAGRNSFLEQIVTPTEKGVWVTASAQAWIYDDGFVGPAFWDRGLLLSVTEAGGSPTLAQENTPITAQTPRNQWVTLRARVFIPVDAVDPRVEVRLYAPGGVVRWDDVTLVHDVTSSPETEYPTSWGYPEPGDEPGAERVGVNKRYDGGSGGEGGADAAWARGLLIPNRIARTFAGYGSDNLDEYGNERNRDDPDYVAPYDDTKLVQMGVWMIDRVTYSTDGTIRLDCRDLGKLLLNQVIYPPMIPLSRYPLKYCPAQETLPDGTPGQVMGNPGDPGIIDDWSNACRELLGWAGLTWYAREEIYPGVPPDPLLGVDGATGVSLRVWADVEVLGAPPILCTTAQWLMNKTFAEAITLLKDMVGAHFWFDESSRAIFRLPNVFSGGNFIHTPDSPEPDPYVDRHPIEFHENANLTEYTVTLDDSAVRSEILVIGRSPDLTSSGVIAGGYVLEDSDGGEPNAIDFTNVLAGQTRLMLVPYEDTEHFGTEEECRRMAEMIALRILFSYRQGQLTAPWHPGLQIDDQVRIYERVTNEFYIHYVSAITTSLDLEAGSATMQVTTHWLGDNPYYDWFINHAELTPAVLNLPAVAARLAYNTNVPRAGLVGLSSLTAAGVVNP